MWKIIDIVTLISKSPEVIRTILYNSNKKCLKFCGALELRYVHNECMQ